MNNDKLINAIILYHSGKIELNKIKENDLINDYELYAPISKYQISIGVIPRDELEEDEKEINLIATNIYNGLILGDCVIVSDKEEEIPIYYEEIIIKYKDLI
jgi:hypothetical protein